MCGRDASHGTAGGRPPEARSTRHGAGLAPEGEIPMTRYVCDFCGWVYDPAEGMPEEGIAPGTAFEDLPDDFVCPECGAGKDDFSREE